MLITHKIDDFLYTIFPNVSKGDAESLKKAIEDYFTFGSFKPKVSINEDWITIEIDSANLLSLNNDFRRVVSLC